MNAPTALTASAVGSATATLTWVASVGATLYKVMRATANAAGGGWGAWAQINDSPVAGTTYTDNATNSTPDPVVGGRYLYAVVASDGVDDSIFSNTVTANLSAAALRVPGDMEGDLADMLSTDDFGDAATYTEYGQSPVTIYGHFDNAAADAGMFERDAQQSTPEFLCKTSDVDSAGTKDTLQISGITYRVKNVEHDGTGLTTLKLSKDRG